MSWLARFEASMVASPTWFDILIDMAVRGGALIVAAILVAMVMQRASAARRHFVWVSVFVALLVLPAVSGGLPRWPMRVMFWRHSQAEADYLHAARIDAITAEINDGIPGRNGFVYQGDDAATVTPLTHKEATAGPTTARVGRSFWHSVTCWHVAGMIWALGVMLAISPWLVGLARRRRMARGSRVCDDSRIVAATARLKKQLEIRMRVTVLEHPESVMPVSWGVFKAVLLLPSESRNWSSQRLEAVLLHELGHVQRHDCLVQHFVQIISVLYWFNPLVWLAARKLRVDRERACDDLVLANGVSPADYAQELLAIAKTLHMRATEPHAAVAMAMPSNPRGDCG